MLAEFPTFIYDLPNKYAFQAHLDNVQTKKGKSPDDFKAMAKQKGFTQNDELKSNVKTGDVVKWLKDDYAIEHGHATAIYALLKGVQRRRLNP